MINHNEKEKEKRNFYYSKLFFLIAHFEFEVKILKGARTH
jgi:hypothetical protein